MHSRSGPRHTAIDRRSLETAKRVNASRARGSRRISRDICISMALPRLSAGFNEQLLARVDSAFQLDQLSILMKMVREFLTVALIAFFALGSMVQAATSTTMAAEMAAADVQSGGNSICQACPDDSNASPSCDLICLTTVVALPTSLEVERVSTHTKFMRAPDRDSLGQFGSLDPAPPKSII